jgi:hypothetical protein
MNSALYKRSTNKLQSEGIEGVLLRQSLSIYCKLMASSSRKVEVLFS